MNEIALSNICMPVVAEFGLLAASEPFYHMDRIADFNVMIYVTGGVIYVTEDEIDYEVNPGELLFLKSGVYHYGKREIDRGTRWYYAHFYIEKKKYEQFSNHNHIQEILLPKKLTGIEESHAAHMIEKCNDDFYSDNSRRLWNINAAFFDILTELAFISGTKSRQEKLADKICVYLTQHCCEPFSAKALENEFYLSYKYMASVFKNERQMTMQQYHTVVRMTTACRLLRSTLMPISEVALAVGYNDALYFSRCFHSIIGVSPSIYRKDIMIN